MGELKFKKHPFCGYRAPWDILSSFLKKPVLLRSDEV